MPKKKSGQAATNDAPTPAATTPPDATARLERPAFEQEGAVPARPAAADHDDPLSGLFTTDPVEQPQRRAAPSLDDLDELALYTMRQEIDARLPLRDLASVDLVEELLLQFYTAKGLMARVQNDIAVPANQKAQVLNSCVNVLEQISRIQTRLYDAERQKMLELCIEKALQSSPLPVKEAFFERYSALLREAADKKEDKKTS